MVTPAPPAAVEVRGVSKRFGATRALEDVDLVVRAGEIRALIGENGSGKSTLIKVLSGFHSPDVGSLKVRGVEVELPIRSKTVRQQHLAFVHQDLGLIPSLTAVENFELGRLAGEASLYLNWRQRRRRFRRVVGRYGLGIDPGVTVGDLTRTAQTLLAIARAVEDLASEEPRAPDQATGDGRGAAGGGLLVLDEPTVSLPRSGVAELFALMRTIARRHIGVLFVSHDLDEVMEIADTLTVIRNGRVVADRTVATLERAEIPRLMLGSELHGGTAGGAAGGAAPAGREDVASVRALSGTTLREASFAVRGGEILGLTGLMGSGYEEVCPLVFGAVPARAGEIRVGDRTVGARHMDPMRAIALGVGYVPEDRKRDAGVETLSVEENLSISVVSETSRLGALQRGELKRRALELVERYQVRPLDPRLPFSALSGGNQQKVVLAKWMALAPRLLLLQEPTQGVDIGARQEIFRLVRGVSADEGTSVLVASTDLEQLSELCTRVLVFFRGTIVAEVEGTDITKHALTVAMLGDQDVPDAGPMSPQPE